MRVFDQPALKHPLLVLLCTPSEQPMMQYRRRPSEHYTHVQLWVIGTMCLTLGATERDMREYRPGSDNTYNTNEKYKPGPAAEFCSAE